MKQHKIILSKAVLLALVVLGGIAGTLAATHFAAKSAAVAADPGGN